MTLRHGLCSTVTKPPYRTSGTSPPYLSQVLLHPDAPIYAVMLSIFPTAA